MTSQNPFSGPDLSGTHYERANMAASNFDGVSLENASFFAVLSGATFKDTNLGAASFDDVNLGQASFQNVNLSGAVIRDANLSGVRISQATLANLDISDADVRGMKINGVLVTDLFAAYESKTG